MTDHTTNDNSGRAAATAQDEFYIGYLPSSPIGVRGRVRAAVLLTMLAGLIAAASIAGAFSSPGPATWSAENAAFTGRMIERPYPMLRMMGERGTIRRALLVSTGKHGAAARVVGLEGEKVRLRGTALERDGRLMIEIADEPQAVVKLGETELVDVPAAVSTGPGPGAAGPTTLVGEIIDPKCFLGAMKPGEGKLHKACAIRCISGGIPPMLAARNPGGGISYYLLVAADGGPLNRRVLPFVAEPVEVTGELSEVEGQSVMRVEGAASGIRRVTGNP